jgi:hypothetical protein
MNHGGRNDIQKQARANKHKKKPLNTKASSKNVILFCVHACVCVSAREKALAIKNRTLQQKRNIRYP